MNSLSQTLKKSGITLEAMEKSFQPKTQKEHPGFPAPGKGVTGKPLDFPGSATTPEWYPYQPPAISGGTRFFSYAGAFGLAILILLALPITQLLSEKGSAASTVVMESVSIPPPPAPPPEPPPPEEELVEEDVPELEQELQPLDLSQLDVALNPGVGDALSMGNAILGFGVTPNTIAQMDIFELKDLDNDPQRIVAVAPVYPFQFKRDGINGWVKLIIIIDERGKVVNAVVESSSHREFEKPGIEAVLQWRFEPGTRNGKPVKVRRLQPITFRLR